MCIPKSANMMIVSVVTLFVVAMLTLELNLSYASDMGLYIGMPSWYDNAVMLQDAEKIVQGVSGVLKEIKTFNDDQLPDLEAWAKANLDDDELDIIWLPGSTPSVLYPIPDLERDGLTRLRIRAEAEVHDQLLGRPHHATVVRVRRQRLPVV